MNDHNQMEGKRDITVFLWFHTFPTCDKNDEKSSFFFFNMEVIVRVNEPETEIPIE